VIFAALCLSVAWGFEPDVASPQAVNAKQASGIFEAAPVFAPRVQKSSLAPIMGHATFRPAMVLAPLEENYPQQSTQYQIQHVVETQNVPVVQPIMQNIERHAQPTQNTIIERIVQPVVNEQTTARLQTNVEEAKASAPVQNAPITQEMTLPALHQSETLPVLETKQYQAGAAALLASSGGFGSSGFGSSGFGSSGFGFLSSSTGGLIQPIATSAKSGAASSDPPTATCHGYSTCSDCAADYNCAWCSDSTTCYGAADPECQNCSKCVGAPTQCS